MIIKFSKIINCSSQHPSYPATNLLEYDSSRESSTWLCGKAGILESELIFELSEPAPITGIDIGNSRCCSVRISGSTNSEPDNWTTIIEHEFMSRNDAEDDRFKDQVQLFTKKELKDEIMKIVFARVKVTCMQPANTKVLFGLSFLILRTDDKSDSDNLDAFGRFKVKQKKDDSLDEFKEKYLQQIRPKKQQLGNFKTEIAKQIEEKKRAVINDEKRNDDDPGIVSRRRASLNSSRASPEPGTSSRAIKREGMKLEESESDERSIKRMKICENDTKESNSGSKNSSETRIPGSRISKEEDNKIEMTDKILCKDTVKVRPRCSLCLGNEENVLCKICQLLKPDKEEKTERKESGKERRPREKPKAKIVKKPEKDFNKFFEGVAFSLSGYKNPERDEIRRKAIAMGAKYVFDTDKRDHGCTHLVCAFKNTPKYNQLKGKVKIVSHRWIAECYDKKIRFPWRRYALDRNDKDERESEEEIMSSSGPPAQPTGIYDQDTDSDY